MKCRDVEPMLVDLADGTLSPEEKALVDDHVAHCAGCAMDVALLKETFAVLRTEVQELPPEHYFSNLLPKVRLRIDAKERPWGFAFPAWIGKMTAPLTVSAMALVVVALFRAFEPGDEHSPLRSIVEQIPGDEIASIVVSPTEPTGGEYGVPETQVLLEALPNANGIADKMKSELLAGELPLVQTEAGTLSVEKTLDDLDDDTVSQVLDRMNGNTTL